MTRLEAWEKYKLELGPHGPLLVEQAIFGAGWRAAVEAAADVADKWDHRGDPGEAMYASPRIRDRIKRLVSG